VISRWRRAMFCVLALSATACGRHVDAQERPTQPDVPTATARIGAFTETISAVGRIGAPAGTATKVSFAEAGILRSIDVHIGEHVAAGEPLAQLDTSGLALSAQQAQADAAAAAANVRQSSVDRTSTKIAVDQAALRRAQSLYAAGVAPFKDVEAARAQLAQDRAEASTAAASVQGSSAQFESARARAALAQRDLANGTLRSPVDGVVAAINKRDGEAVDTTTPVLSIAPQSSNSVTLDVTAADAARIHAGNPVQLSIPGTSLHASGAVTGVSAALDPATQAATVVVSGVPAGAPAGSAVQAQIDIANDRGVLIPQTAIVQDPQSGDTLVFVQSRMKDGGVKFEQRSVNVAHQNGRDALISSGLHAGERVAAQGAFNLLAPAGGGD
jgi:RND family efflux transporter MFP subunit